ncbi:FadR/GntR family transcriptional regulator [Dinoroseobacter sp. S124A]|uniref:FadR/GntR family transcriptional regulator n=1 Tax=Dinoroseobacter sp. S124A TaxID=3415128 RepID=UPI003C7ED39C
MDYQLDPGRDLAVQIADAIKDAILREDLLVDDRLPSEAELSERFEVSRPTVREALKRLAAQNLIRTQRGATGGAFVNRLSFAEAAAQQETTATLVLSMNAVDFETACEARFALERAVAPLAAARREDAHLAAMSAEVTRQADPGLSDTDFCASDVAFHRVLVEAAGNPVLSYQLAGAVEGMQPLMNMITYTERSRARIATLHQRIRDAMAARDGAGVTAALSDLADYTADLGSQMRAKRAAR